MQTEGVAGVNNYSLMGLTVTCFDLLIQVCNCSDNTKEIILLRPVFARVEGHSTYKFRNLQYEPLVGPQHCSP